jgi:putative nucleotidyltransferase with HDIG domain
MITLKEVKVLGSLSLTDIEHMICVSMIMHDFLKWRGAATNQVKKGSSAAYFHDIGKVKIPRHILDAPRALTFEEREIVKKHVEHSAEILEGMEMSQEIIAAVLAHHENYDGSGYPKGLKGEEIPFFGRVLRIVDSWHAITSNRSYHLGKSKGHTVEEMIKYKNHYDPELMDEFLLFIEEYNNDEGQIDPQEHKDAS